MNLIYQLILPTTVTGTITTDGTLGSPWDAALHIVDFDLTWPTGQHLTAANAIVSYVAGVSADAEELYFYPHERSYLFFIGEEAVLGYGTNWDCLTCQYVFANQGMAVPEPASGLLLAVALLLGALVKRCSR